MKIFVRRWLPLIAWIVVIFVLSSIPGVQFEGPELPTNIDKIAHFFEYAILAYVLHRGLSYHSERGGLALVAIVVACAIGVAVLDELYQLLIPGRESSVADVVSDAAGVAAGTAVAVIRKRAAAT